MKKRNNRSPFERLPKAPDPGLMFADENSSGIVEDFKPGETPLGELLASHRKALNWSRAELARRTSIGQNSIVRYEKAGLEEEGQYPTANKLALLCFELGISPTEAMIACLPLEMRDEGHVAYRGSFKHPMYDYMKDQYTELLHDSHLYRSLFAKLFGPKPELNSKEYEQLLFMIGAAKETYKKQEKFENVMSEYGQFVPIARTYNEASMPEFIIDDWVYKSTANINLVEGDKIADCLGWKKPEQRDFIKDLWSRNEQHIMHVNWDKDHYDKKEEPGSFGDTPGSKSTLPDQRKEVDDG